MLGHLLAVLLLPAVVVAVPPVVAGAEVSQMAGMDWADLLQQREPVQTEPTLLRVVAMWEA